jgi:hypothetical protein
MKTQGKAVLGCVVAACLSSTAMARPTTPKDFAGKKVCWNSPTAPPTCANAEETYYPGGKFYSTCWGNGTCHAHHCDTDKGSFDFQTEKLRDGTFKATVNINGAIYESTGHYCQ